jgi:DNA-binding NtrC family response regulator
MRKILIVDDEKNVRYSFERFLTAPEYSVESARNGAEALKKFEQEDYELIILDVRLPDMSGLDVLRRMKTLDSRAVVLIITAFGSTDIAIEATKAGAYDYIQKPFDMPLMKKLIDEALLCSYRMKTNVVIERDSDVDESGDRMVGNSLVMQEVYKTIGRVAESDVNVLLRGESGTGKELVARAIYQHSKRSQGPFLAVNCAAIPETLLESELFGYEKGAFTGAVRRKIGKFEQVHGGTIFLDEIGDMSLSTQSKILRVLQEGCFERLGGELTLRTDVRVIAATNRNLEKAITEGRFREDLYYRIKVVTITLPPLRLRHEDIPALVAYFIERYSVPLRGETITLSAKGFEKVQSYSWPGNVRELENFLKSAIVLCKGNVITEEAIEELVKNEEIKNTGVRSDESDNDIEKLIALYEGSLHDKVMSDTEGKIIQGVLKHTRGNQVKAARILGISRSMLFDRIQKYNIDISTVVLKRHS